MQRLLLQVPERLSCRVEADLYLEFHVYCRFGDK